ncbi:MAG: hypothetical protein JSS02_17625 [Planctomycetes bacterium]|nr:hypothetical protein [Planctomycetota bacterium]
MAKRLLIMALVAMQCASWGGASLFFCFGPDGSFCIDGGPADCSCCIDKPHTECEASDSAHGCGCHAADAHTESLPTAPDAVEATVDPLIARHHCHCLHLQVSQGPTLVNRSHRECELLRQAAQISQTAVGCPGTVALPVETAWRVPLPDGGLAFSLLTVTVAVRIC